MAGFIGLADAKAHLRVTSDSEDSFIQSLIDAASARIEQLTGHVAETREETFLFDCFGAALELRLRPVNPDTITITYLDGDGEARSFTDIRAVEKHGTTRILPAVGFAWPATLGGPGAVTVTASVGLDASDADGAADAPETLKHATRLIVGEWHENRESSGNRETGMLPLGVAWLLEGHRLTRV